MKTIKGLFILIIIGLAGCQIVIEEPYEPANRFVGSYEVDEWSETLGLQSFFEIYIHKDRFESDIIYIDNFYDLGIEVFAEVNGSRIRIPRQVAGFYEIEGLGSLYNGELSLDYSVRDINSYTGLVDYCNAISYQY